ncbi:MAG: hypothetical protein ACRCUT_00175 [Spirochaetota bacterium]
MRAESAQGYIPEGEPFLPVFLSLVCPGLGQLYNGDFSRGWAVFFLRILIPLFPAAYLFDSRHEAVPVLASGAALFLAVHVYSCIDAWRHAKVKCSAHCAPMAAFFAAGMVSFAAAAGIAAALFPVILLTDSGLSPSYSPGHYLLCSVRSRVSYVPGDAVFYRKSGSVYAGRILSLTEGDIIGFAGGRITLSGDILEQEAPPSSDDPADETLFIEKAPWGKYPVLRSPGADAVNAGTSVVSADAAAVCADNRIEGGVEIVSMSDIEAKIEAEIPLYPLSSSKRRIPDKAEKE